MVLSNDSTGGEFESTLGKHARGLVDYFERGHSQQTVRLIQKLSQARDRSLYQGVGKLIRELHNAIVDFQIGPHSPHAQEMSQVTDVTDRLSYVVEMAEKAANRTMDLVEQSAPLVNQPGNDPQELHQKWQCFVRREIGADGFHELAKRIEQSLVRSGKNAGQSSPQLNDILLMQDCQGLVGQMIKHVTKLATEVGSNLVKLVWMAGQVSRYAGIEHGHVSMRHQATLEHSTKDEGPRAAAGKREDVVSGQDDIDDLLSSLDF